VTGVDVPPEGEAAGRADDSGESERSTIGEKTLAKRNKQRTLPHEDRSRRNPPIGRKQQRPYWAALSFVLSLSLSPCEGACG
jgi:hypothetical protein